MELIERKFPLVLQSILDKLDHSDLARCRFVNKTWHKEAWLVLRKRRGTQFQRWITFKRLDQLELFCKPFEAAGETTSVLPDTIHFHPKLFTVSSGGKKKEKEIIELQSCLSRLADIAGEAVLRLSVSFDGVKPHSTGGVLYQELHKIIYKGFPNVKDLSVGLGSTLFLPEGSEQLNVSLTPKPLPNLLKLNLSMSAHKEDLSKCEGGVGAFVADLLSSAVNLRELETEAIGENWLMLRSIIANLSVSPALESLNLGKGLRNEDVDALTSRALPNLTHLKFHLHPARLRGEPVENLIQKYSGTLRRLEFKFRHHDTTVVISKMPPPGVVMEELEELTMFNYCGVEVGLSNMPKLKKLTVTRSSNVSRILSTFTFPNTASSSLTELTMSGTAAVVGHEKMLFPVEDPGWLTGLTKLHLQGLKLPRATFTSIARNCGQLRDLSFEDCKKVDDEAVTGTSTFILHFVSPLGSLQGLARATQLTEEPIDVMIAMAKAVPRSRAWIGSLTNLQALTLMHCKITDAAILFGIVHCAQLRKLRCGGLRSSLTWRAEQIMKQGLRDLVELDVVK